MEDSVCAEGSLSLEQVVIDLARKHKVKLATAESCTGGLVANRLTDISGSSDVFEFGWVTYANEAKIQELGVPRELLDCSLNPEAPGAVSEEVACAMAQGALDKSHADLAVSLTGIAGPTGGSIDKPVGTVWIGMADRKAKPKAVRRFFPVDRKTFKHMASQAALDLLRKNLVYSISSSDVLMNVHT